MTTGSVVRAVVVVKSVAVVHDVLSVIRVVTLVSNTVFEMVVRLVSVDQV